MTDDVNRKPLPGEIRCGQCSRWFEPSQGRGRKSRYCDDCRRQRAKIRASLRAFGVMSARMIEVSLLYGATLTRKREEVTTEQDGRCKRCDRRRHLFLIESNGDGLIGLCIDDFTKEVHGGEQTAIQNGQAVPGGSSGSRGRERRRGAVRPRAGAGGDGGPGDGRGSADRV